MSRRSPAARSRSSAASRSPPGQPIGISGRRLRLQLAPEGTGSSSRRSCERHGRRRRAGVRRRRLPAGHRPGRRPNMLWSVETLSGVAGSLSVPPAHGAVSCCPPMPRPTRWWARRRVVAVRRRSTATSTTLGLSAPLTRIYDASTVRVNANAVHGHQRARPCRRSSARAMRPPSPAVHAQAGTADLRHRARRRRGRSRPCRYG